MSALPKRKPREPRFKHEASDFGKRMVEAALNSESRVEELLAWIGMLEHAAFVAPLAKSSQLVESGRVQGFDGGFVAGYAARAWKVVSKEHADLSIAEQAVLVEQEEKEARVLAESFRRKQA
jgi:hypothetical protein